MAYQVLARKWRPQDFSALVGQEPIVTALRNALREGRVAQAYLFSGIRGVGKTTTARLLAKALNCEKGALGDPCNDCLTCEEITRGADLDVIEVDAATYSKVEQVRELTESLRYGPARDRYKVVVLDEIHRLSRQAFDALLKIVEEPPAHLVFIFATTEIEAVPATILSRCQEFRFRRVTSAALVEHLRQISVAEEIQASETALRLIARAGEGSVRDAVALLDQLATFGAGTIRDEDAARLAGSLDARLYISLLQAIVAGRSREVSALARQIEDEGWDPRHVYNQFLGFSRDGLHLAAGGDPGQVELPREDVESLARLAHDAGYENLLRLLQLLLAGEEAVRRSDASALAMEITWLRAAELPRLVAIEQLLAGAPAPRPAREAATAAPTIAAPQARPEPASPAPAAPRPAAPLVAAEAPPPTPPPSRPAATTSGGLLEEISRRSQPLAAHLAAAEEVTLTDGELTIYLPAGADGEHLARALERQRYREILDEVVGLLQGKGGSWRTAASRRSAAKPAATAPAPMPAEVTQHPTVQAVLDIFGGTVATVAPHGEPQEDWD